jgi:predicted regulator of Ras-like GTPase activity (Roadblock/LC7/MglB family)
VEEVEAICRQLLASSNALGVWLVDRDGRTLARIAETEIDVELVMAACRHLLEHGEFHEFYDTLDDEERKLFRHVNVTLIGGGAVLAVVFDERSSLGLVRLRCHKAKHDLAKALARSSSGGSGAPATRDID